MFKTKKARLGLVVLAAGASVAVATPAMAAVGGSVVVNPGQVLYVRTAPSSTAAKVGSLNGGTFVSIECKTTGNSVTGSQGTTSDWDRLTNGGYVSAAYVKNGRNAPLCAGTPGPPAPPAPVGLSTALAWGKTQVGTYYVGCYAGNARFGQVSNKTRKFSTGDCASRAYVLPANTVGYDCSGLIVTIYKKAGINLTRQSSTAMLGYTGVRKDLNYLRPGDLFVKKGHVSIYLGNNEVLESTPHVATGNGTWKGTRVTSVSKWMADSKYVVRRILN